MISGTPRLSFRDGAQRRARNPEQQAPSRGTGFRTRRRAAPRNGVVAFASAVAIGLALACAPAGAETKIRVGKAQPNQFAFVPADIGVETGIFKKRGVDAEISAFGGDARMM